MPRQQSTPKTLNYAPVALLILAAAFAMYAAVFIYQTSGVVDGVRYFILQDDGMISMRYARNLVHGYGFVWNPGGLRVEGFTNLLWVLYMALLHLLPVAAAKMSLLVQVTAAAVVAAAAVAAARLTTLLVSPTGLVISESADHSGASRTRPTVRAAGVIAAACTLFYYPFVNWSLQGSEVCAMALVITAAAILAAKILGGRPFVAHLYGVLAIGVLLRADGFVPYIAFLAAMLVMDRPDRLRHLAIGLGGLVILLAALTAWREATFGYPLPNTYYLKMTGYPLLARILSGAHCFAAFCKHSWLVPVVATLLSIPLWKDRRVALIVWVIFAQAAYSIFVGGDAWEWWGGANRYLCEVTPIFFCLLALTGRHYYIGLTGDSLALRVTRWSVTQGRLAIVVLGIGAFIGIDSAMSNPSEALLLSPPPEVGSNRVNVEYAGAVSRLTTPAASVAVMWAGATPYFCERRYIDLLGKCDAYVAHTPMHLPARATVDKGFYPGHMKWDFAYSIGKLRPDVVLTVDQLLANHPDCAPYMEPYGVLQHGDLVIALRRGSPGWIGDPWTDR